MVTGQSAGLEQAKRLERGLVLVRWFGVALGVYLTTQTNAAGILPAASDLVLALSFVSIGALGVGNVAISIATRRAETLRGIRIIGVCAFALDAAVIFAQAWMFTYNPNDPTWVVMLILPLEGAIRYQLSGALVIVLASLISEVGREAFLAERFAESRFYGGGFIEQYPFSFSHVAFRIGVQLIIAVVAGFMARSLAREARNAAEQAARFEDVARRESAARRELAAFNTAILTGVAAEDLDSSLQLMAEAIARDLGYETFAILLLEEDELITKGMAGLPLYEDPIPIGRGVTGTVAATGEPILVPNVDEFPDYISGDPEIRSEMVAPIKIGDDTLGVLDVESRSPAAFDQASLDLLTRLADQVALVVHSNQLLSRQRETMTKLQQLDQMKSDFVAITSHELRTPLTAIRGFVKTLIRNRDRISDQQVDDFMNIIDRQSERLARLVEDLLLVTRIEAGKIRLAVEEVELAETLREAVDSFGPEDRSRIELRVEPDAGSVTIDPHRLEQVLRNLVENALKFSPPNSMVAVEAGTNDGWLHFTVSDRGPGIPEEHLATIFDRFHQAGPVLTREAEGAGLGLYITKRLVEAMGGSVEVSSTLGQGSTFRVRLPRLTVSVGDGHIGTLAPEAGNGPVGPAEREPEAAPTAERRPA